MDIPKDNLIPLLRDFFRPIPDCGINNLADIRRVSILVDNIYSPLKKTEITSTLKSNPLLSGDAEATDKSELFDCDDYALQLKSSLTALYRSMRRSGNSVSPPALGVVITQNHALNIVLCETGNARLAFFLVDPSLKSPRMVSDPSASLELLKVLPISLIYI